MRYAKSGTLQVERFLAGLHPSELPDRVLATLLFTDIADSTRKSRRARR
jgi:class 3 adenylate cyclase